MIHGNFLVQSEYRTANHDAVRNAENVLTRVKEAGINNFQRENFLGNMADDGKFTKLSIGVVYRPIKSVAIKLDASSHIQKFNGKTESYPEIRLDISFAFK